MSQSLFNHINIYDWENFDEVSDLRLYKKSKWRYSIYIGKSEASFLKKLGNYLILKFFACFNPYRLFNIIETNFL